MASDVPQIGPVSLQPIFVERVWGTDNLGPWYPRPPHGKSIGEAWLTAEDCLVEAPQSASGTTLKQLTERAPEKMGNVSGAGFPLLIKVLYPREKLSVQVHPDDAQAQALGQPRGKTECWYVLAAEPDAQLALGFREAMTPQQIAHAIADGTVEDKLRYLPVRAGEMVFVDAGTVHAIGPGMVVLETQQYSDTTYRLWDYGRPRELHIEQGLGVTRTQTRAGILEAVPMGEFTRLLSCPYFTVDRFSMKPGEEKPLGNASELQVLIALGSSCTLQSGSAAPLALTPGHAVVLPAEGISYRLSSASEGDVIRVLSGAGTSSAA